MGAPVMPSDEDGFSERQQGGEHSKDGCGEACCSVTAMVKLLSEWPLVLDSDPAPCVELGPTQAEMDL
ncbi:hypothetical protein NDU88_007980 [Pleurodeles waltl]|uniref:Uncharacterized protein n=1 Tax=Pleurodeles waltl TaxID=8319 RepID=A0AAV7P3P3_PLEWA|nr:hypothetical protein NDU88_007980 [Pleurodeles waltl]